MDVIGSHTMSASICTKSANTAAERNLYFRSGTVSSQQSSIKIGHSLCVQGVGRNRVVLFVRQFDIVNALCAGHRFVNVHTRRVLLPAICLYVKSIPSVM